MTAPIITNTTSKTEMVNENEQQQCARRRNRSRYTASIVALVPNVFLLVSFVLALVATTSKEWSYNDVSNTDNTGGTVVTRIHRSPFINCQATSPKNVFIEDCTIKPLCDPTNDADYITLCYLLAFSRRTMTAADVMVGVGLGLSLLMSVIVLAGRPRHFLRHHHRHSSHRPNTPLAYLALLTLLLTLASALTLLITHFLASDMLVNHQQPMGNFITNGGATADLSPWMPGRAQKYLFVAWGFGVLAAAAMGAVWRFPKWGWDGERDGDLERER